MKLHVPANFIGYGSFSLSAMLGVAYLLAARGILASRLPKLEIIDDMMYKAIAIGFAFFTIATILGAMWAAEAWGGYWTLGSERNLGADRVAELRRLAAHPPGQGPARPDAGMVGGGRAAGHDVCLPRRQYVSVGPALLRHPVKPVSQGGHE